MYGKNTKQIGTLCFRCVSLVEQDKVKSFLCANMFNNMIVYFYPHLTDETKKLTVISEVNEVIHGSEVGPLFPPEKKHMTFNQ